MTKHQLGQYFNIDGILFNLKYLFSLNSIKPDLYFKSIVKINLNELKNQHSIKYVVFDKDNTLTLPHQNIFGNEKIKDKIEDFKNVFGQNNLAILSNSAGSKDDLNFKEAKEIELKTGLQVIKHKYKKPKVYNEIIDTFGIKNDIKNSEICIIGDRLLIDIIMGKEYGFFTILVDPITTSKDNFMVRMMRKVEKFLIKNKKMI